MILENSLSGERPSVAATETLANTASASHRPKSGLYLGFCQATHHTAWPAPLAVSRHGFIHPPHRGLDVITLGEQRPVEPVECFGL